MVHGQHRDWAVMEERASQLNPDVSLPVPEIISIANLSPVLAKYYTEDHEWIDVSEDKKIGMDALVMEGAIAYESIRDYWYNKICRQIPR